MSIKTMRITTIAFFALFAVTSIWAAPETEYEDPGFAIWQNADFEAGTDHWDFGKEWGKMPADLQESNVEIIEGDAVSGKKFLRIHNNGEGAFLNVKQNVKWEAGKTYILTFWLRGVQREGNGIRVRVEGSGAPQDFYDTNYKNTDWKYHTGVIDATMDRRGYLAVWVWKGGYADIDNLSLRESFWSSDKDNNAMERGDTATVNFAMKGEKKDNVTVEYSITSPSGISVAKETVKKQTPFELNVRVKGEEPGVYEVNSVTKTSSGVFRDKLILCVLAPREGEAGVKTFWTTL